ncbi:tetratricopeptide repeat protein [Prosthecobacter sp.]|uniref:tetratricopeptide repeat protein n=1 Tax=Prosthecobacter sp. TaxID=1965333 RepID=UPI003784B30F
MTDSDKSPMRHFRYNPRWQEPNELERLYVARKPLLARLHAQIAEQGTTSAPRHHLIIGQRGMGKTTLLMRLALELKQKNPDFLPLTFWEEQYVEVDRLSVFWLNCLDSMADSFEAMQETGAVEQIDLEVRRLEKISSEEERAREAAQCFAEAITRGGKRLVLFIDNFNLLIARLKEHDHVLRGFFTRHGAPIIVGAGVTPPDEISDYDAAFYDGFQTTLLHRLSMEEVQDMIKRLAEIDQEQQAVSAMWRELPRIAALRDLSGGNPRTCLLIYHLCVQGFAESIYRDLETLLDETTPLFQTRFDQLSDQGQKLVARLARHWFPATADKITEITGFPRGTVSPLLGRLEQEGIIEKVQLFDPNRRDKPKDKPGGFSKRLGYQITERFFSMWLIMRSSSRREREGIRCLSRWLECLYTPEELEHHARQYSCKDALSWDQAVVARALAECVGDGKGGAFDDLLLLADISLLSRVKKGEGNLEGVIDEKKLDSRALNFVALRERLMQSVGPRAKVTPEKFADLVLGSPSILSKKGLSRSIIAQLDDPRPLAVDRLVEMLEEKDEFAVAVGDEALSWLSQRLRNGQLHADDVKSIEASLDQAPNARARACIGAVAQECKSFDLAEKAYRSAVDEDASTGYAWEGLAIIYHKSDRFEEARDAYAKALAINDDSADMCSNYGQLLAIRFNQLPDAVTWLRKAAKLDPRSSVIANNLAACLWFQEGEEKWKEAIQEFRRAAALDLFDPKFHINIGSIYQNKLKDYARAETSYRTAISINNRSGDARFHLALLLHECRHDYPAAEEQYRKAIEIDENDIATWLALGILLLHRLQRPEEAVQAFEKVLVLEPKNESAWYQLALADIMHFGRIGEGKKKLLKILEIKPKCANALNSLGNLEYDVFGNVDEATKYFEAAMEAEPDTDQARHNYLFLIRDSLGDMDRAKSLFAELRQPDQWKDSQALHRALFACYDDNWGLASAALLEALAVIDFGAFPKNSEDDWFRASAVMIKLGFVSKLLSLLEEQGGKTRMMPWFAALEAHKAGDKQLLLNYPPEVRPAAELFYDQIEKRLKLITQSGAEH